MKVRSVLTNSVFSCAEKAFSRSGRFSRMTAM